MDFIEIHGRRFIRTLTEEEWKVVLGGRYGPESRSILKRMHEKQQCFWPARRAQRAYASINTTWDRLKLPYRFVTDPPRLKWDSPSKMLRIQLIEDMSNLRRIATIEHEEKVLLRIVEKYQRELVAENIRKVAGDPKRTFASYTKNELLQHAHYLCGKLQGIVHYRRQRRHARRYLIEILLCVSFAGWYTRQEILEDLAEL